MKSSRIFFPYGIAVFLSLFAFSTIATAQATRTWVSGVGDDVNPCSRTAPCKTFAGAISKTAVNGEIDILDPGGFGAVTITKSVTIDGRAGLGGVLASLTTGITINITAATDTNATVVLRNLSINGVGNGVNGIRIVAAKNVVVEDCIISGFSGVNPNGRGISDVRTSVGAGVTTGSGSLRIVNSDIRNNAQSNLVINPASTLSVNVSLTHSRLENSFSNSGLAVVNGANILVRDSVIAGNSLVGIAAQEDFGSVDINVENSSITHNGTGVQVFAGAPVIRLSNVMLAGNNVGFTGVGIFSFGNNRIAGNNSANGPFAPANILPQQ